jgi:hypothetical protein
MDRGQYLHILQFEMALIPPVSVIEYNFRGALIHQGPGEAFINEGPTDIN